MSTFALIDIHQAVGRVIVWISRRKRGERSVASWMTAAMDGLLERTRTSGGASASTVMAAQQTATVEDRRVAAQGETPQRLNGVTGHDVHLA